MGSVTGRYRLKKFYDGVGSIIQLVLMPLGWSMSVLFLDNLRSGDEYKVGQLFEGFRDYTVWPGR